MKVDYKNYNKRAENLRYFYLTQPGFDDESATIVAALRAYKTVSPWHPPSVWISPNVLLRCSLFQVTQTRAERKYLHRYRYSLQASRGGYVEYTGQELRQSDGDVLMGLLQAEQDTPGMAVVKLRSFAMQLGWGSSNIAVQKVEDAIIRMSATNLEVCTNVLAGKSVKRESHAFSLVLGYKKESDALWLVYLDGRLQGIKSTLYTRIKQSLLRQLPAGAVLASWLLKFLSTHREPRAITFGDLREYCGASSQPKEFRRLVTAAAGQLQKIGFLEEFSVGDEGLKVVRAVAEDGRQDGDEYVVDTPKYASDTPQDAFDPPIYIDDTP